MIFGGVTPFFGYVTKQNLATSIVAHIDSRMNENNDLPPNQWETPLLGARNKTKRLYKCSFCGLLGHNKKKCKRYLEEGMFAVLDFKTLDVDAYYSISATITLLFSSIVGLNIIPNTSNNC